MSYHPGRYTVGQRTNITHIRPLATKSPTNSRTMEEFILSMRLKLYFKGGEEWERKTQEVYLQVNIWTKTRGIPTWVSVDKTLRKQYQGDRVRQTSIN